MSRTTEHDGVENRRGPVNHTVHGTTPQSMTELADESVHLIVTSPPEWDPDRDESLNSHMERLNAVWMECHRVLKPGCRMVVNIGNHYHRSEAGVPYHVTPLNSKIVNGVMETTRHKLGFLGNIIWHKSGDANLGRSEPEEGDAIRPRNPRMNSDYEFVSLFKKSGEPPAVPEELKETDETTPEERDVLFSGHWEFSKDAQTSSHMPFPEELPRRAIRLFTVPGDTVLDPFMGLGSTIRAADNLNRSSIGYETGFDTASGNSWREMVRGYLNPDNSSRFAFDW